MITRYSTKEMQAIWSPEQKFQRWLDVEVAACEAHVQLGNIPAESVEVIKEKAAFTVGRISEIEAEVNHDVIAFLTNLAENIGSDSRFVHLGLTSTDVVDTALCLLIRDAGKLMQQRVTELLAALKKQAHASKDVIMMGRTHGVHAEPLTLGLKVALFYEEVRRSQERLDRALDGLSVGLISGAVGNFAHMPPELEEIVCEKLGLKPAPISSQILQRDRHAELMTAIAILGGTLEKLATEVRSLQKTECSELQEPFSRNQKGSSAMPHKRNPIICERITGMARVLRGYASVALENQALWHERDISHSGAERIIIPDACMLLEYMLIKMTAVVDDWVVHEDRMMKNIEDAYLIFYSQPLLLKLVDKGISREDAYRMVQRRAHRAFDEKMSFETLVREDAELAEHISKADCDEVFSLDRYKKHVGTLFNRLGI